MLLSEEELADLRRACLRAMIDVAPKQCSAEYILRAAELAFENLLEGAPGPNGGYVGEACPTCGQIGAVQANGFRTCMSCDERWKP